MKSLTRTIIVLVIFNLVTGNLALGQNAPEGKLSTYTISGSVDLSDVEMQGLPGIVVTDENGYYSATVDYGWSGTVRPTKDGYTFEPAELPYSRVIRDLTNQNYVPKMITFIISGRTGLSGAVIKGLSGVLMQGLPDAPLTDENGNYQAEVDYGWSGTVTPTKKGFTFSPPRRQYTSVTSDQTNRNYISQRVGPAPMLGRTGGRKVLVIPDSDVKPEELDALTQDLLVMSHILDERFKGPRTIKGVFTDFGDFFGRDNRSTEAIYMQGYGVVFLMEVNFAFSPPLKPEEQKDEETAEQVDPTWQRAREQIFSPRTPRPGMPGFSGQGPGLVKFDQLKKELIETLKHAANIRNLRPDEWIIVTVIGQGRQPGEFYEDYYRSAAPRSRTSTLRRRSSSGGGGMYGGMGSYGGGIYGGMGGQSGQSRMGGQIRMGGQSGQSRMGGQSGQSRMGGMGMAGGMMGGMEYGEMGSPSAKVLTIRAKKSDIGDFARGELDFEEFQQTVEIFTY